MYNFFPICFFAVCSQNQARQFCTLSDACLIWWCHWNTPTESHAQCTQPRKTDWWQKTNNYYHSTAIATSAYANDANANNFTEATTTANTFATTSHANDSDESTAATAAAAKFWYAFTGEAKTQHNEDSSNTNGSVPWKKANAIPTIIAQSSYDE